MLVFIGTMCALVASEIIGSHEGFVASWKLASKWPLFRQGETVVRTTKPKCKVKAFLRVEGPQALSTIMGDEGQCNVGGRKKVCSHATRWIGYYVLENAYILDTNQTNIMDCYLLSLEEQRSNIVLANIATCTCDIMKTCSVDMT